MVNQDARGTTWEQHGVLVVKILDRDVSVQSVQQSLLLRRVQGLQDEQGIRSNRIEIFSSSVIGFALL